MKSLLLWAALGLSPFVPVVTVSQNAGCTTCECCVCRETEDCGCSGCDCCCVGGCPTAVEAGRETCCGAACCR